MEKSYEKALRGEKGMEILMKDAYGRIKGKYENGIHDISPKSGHNLTLSIDMDLQQYGEQLMAGKIGAIVPRVFHLLPFERKVFFGYFKCLAESQSVKILYVFRYDHHVVCGFVEDNEFPVTVIYKSTCRIYDTLEKCIAFSTFLVFVVFSNTVGVNSLACTLLAIIKRPVFYAYIPKDDFSHC